MELVYLWVEDYKNIHKQGFSFSPRFHCEYDGDTLTINENNDYVNIFPDNINVTAIVGKNGSGKSSVLKLILLLLFSKGYDLDSEGFDYHPLFHDNMLETIKPFVNKELFLILHCKDQFKKISMKYLIKKLTDKYKNLVDMKGKKSSLVDYLPGQEKEIKSCNLLYDELSSKELDFFTIHFNYMLDTFYDGVQDKWIKEIYHKADSYQTPLLLEPYKNNNDRQLIDLEIIEYLNSQNMLRFYSMFDSENNIVDFFKPNRISITVRQRAIGDFTNMDDEEFECLSRSFGFIAYKFYETYESGEIFYELREQKKEKICDFIEKIEELYKDKDYLSLNYLYIALKLLSSNRSLFNKNEADKIVEWSYKLDDKDNLLAFKDEIDVNQLLNKEAPQYEVRKIQVCIDFINEKTYENSDFIDNMNKNVEIDSIKSILKFIPPWIDVEWFEDNKTIKSLSSGEKTFFTFLMNLMYQIQNINDRNEYKTINLFFDETELGFHPQWQKEYLIKIIEAIKQVNKKKVNLLFATHSPFLLSDIPKQNIIFLNKDENSNCIVVDGLKDKKETFGANIHTLLSDSFFMENGLMGEFAKNEINKAIEYLSKKQLSQDEINYCENIISIIGEPILRQQLQKMLDSKRLTEIEQIKQEIKRLEDRMTLIWKNSR